MHAIHSVEAEVAAGPHSGPIILAHEPPFQVGPLTIDPGTRRFVHADGRETFVEPRVMQVFVALARASGAILSRDDLILRCWNGRIVGEDAITRVMSRLRRLSDGLGRGVFSIETLTKVGYRLVRHEDGGREMPMAIADARSPPVSLSRRAFTLAGAAAGIAAFAGGGALLLPRAEDPSPNREAELLMAMAWQAWGQGTSDGNAQAIGLYRRAIETAADYPDAWGFLGAAYGDRSHTWARSGERDSLRSRARSAGQRALELDPKNAYGRGAIAFARPMMGNWLLMEREYIRAIEDQPQKWLSTYCLARAHTRVGRFTDAAALFEQVRNVAPTATQYHFQALSLWGAGRLDEADSLMEESAAIYATNPLIWSARVRLLLFSGRSAAAMALAQDGDVRPPSVSDGAIDEIVSVAQALESRNPEQVAATMAMQIRQARDAAGPASYAIQVASALGHVDEAFRLADAYYFSRGAVIPDEPVAPGQMPAVSLNERATGFLFLPPTRAMREDPRFPRLVAALGLERYWREANAQPDFRSQA